MNNLNIGHRHKYISYFAPVEFCYKSDSELSNPEYFRRDYLFAVSVCDDNVFTLKSTVDKVLRCIRTRNDHVRYSGPCTAGCPYDTNASRTKGKPKTLQKNKTKPLNNL